MIQSWNGTKSNVPIQRIYTVEDIAKILGIGRTSAYNLVKGEYRGVALLGIEALALKMKGFSGGEIALLYGVQPNVVGAWISRAAEKLRSNQRFMARL